MAAQSLSTTATLPIDHRSPALEVNDSPLSSAGLTALLAILALVAVSYPVPATAVAVGWVLQRLLRR